MWTITRNGASYAYRISYYSALWTAQFFAAFSTSTRYAIVHPDGTVEPVGRF